MTKITKFEDLIVWQEARKLSNQVFVLCNNQNLSKEFELRSQIKRSAVSVMANIAEGFGRFSLKEAKQFYIVSRGSLSETQSHLYVLLDQGYVSKKDFEGIYELSEHVNKLLNGLIQKLLKYMK